METNPLKMKPYYLSTFTKSLKTPSYKTMPQWSFKKTISKWTSMPGCTISCKDKYVSACIFLCLLLRSYERNGNDMIEN